MSIKLHPFYINLFFFLFFKNLQEKGLLFNLNCLTLFKFLLIILTFYLSSVAGSILNYRVLKNNRTRDAVTDQQGNENWFQSQGHICDKCNRIYSHQQSLRNHQKFECGKIAQFSCPHCDYRSKRKGNMKSHILHVHSHVLQNL